MNTLYMKCIPILTEGFGICFYFQYGFQRVYLIWNYQLQIYIGSLLCVFINTASCFQIIVPFVHFVNFHELYMRDFRL